MNKFNYIFIGSMCVVGALIGTWALTAFTFALHNLNWDITEMIRQYLISTGNLGEYETMVDYYTHIKGVEYLIAVGFFVVFPVFYRLLERRDKISVQA